MWPWARLHRRLVTLAGAGVVAAVMVIWGLHSLTAPFPRHGANSCAAGTVIKRSAVTISVYNAGAPAGSAAKLAKSLTELGFKIAKVGNAPSGITVTKAQVVGTSITDPAAQLVAAVIGTPVTDDANLLIGSGVNLFIGPQLGPLVSSAPTEITVGDAAICSN